MIRKVEDLSEYLDFVSKGLCVVKFTAKWCGPCKAIGPVYKDLESQHGEKITFLEVDLDNAEEISERENVTSIPRFFFYSDGVKRTEMNIVGGKKDELIKNVSTFLSETEQKPVVVFAGKVSQELEKLTLDEESDDESLLSEQTDEENDH